MTDASDQLVDLGKVIRSISDELDAHKVIMAHLYNCLEDFGLPRVLAANSLKRLQQEEAIQEQLDMFAEGILATVDPQPSHYLN